VTVEKVWHELWGGVKGQSNWEIARSLRNIFRNSLLRHPMGVELLDGFGARKSTRANQTPNTMGEGKGVRRRVTISVVKRATVQTAG
jgi:hypothetical protein